MKEKQGPLIRILNKIEGQIRGIQNRRFDFL
jgi:hypothetical protein